MHSNFLLFADDLKIFRRITSPVDAFYLQRDVQCLEMWCDTNKLSLSLSKCHVVHFTRKKDSYLHKYTLNGSLLAAVDSVRDLGITFSNDLSFDKHISLTIGSAFKRLGFVIRACKFFQNVSTLKLLYCTLVRL